eukprot:11179847-Lingulodinium_polyedra.AAC.1
MGWPRRVRAKALLVAAAVAIVAPVVFDGPALAVPADARLLAALAVCPRGCQASCCARARDRCA